MKRHQPGIRWIIGFAASMLIVETAWTYDDYHDFTDTQGRTVKGELIEFITSEEIATIRAESGKDYPIPLLKLCEADRQYVRNWGLVRDFNRILQVVPNLKTYDIPQVDYGKNYNADNIKCQGYKIELANVSTTSFHDIEIDYCLFYHQGNRSARSMIYDEGVQSGKFKIGEVPIGSKQELATKAVLLYDESGPTSLFGRSEGARGELVGLWLRIRATLPTGDRLTRDICQPGNLSDCKKWTNHSMHVGLNRNPRLRSAVAHAIE